MCRCRVRSTWHLHEFEIAGRRYGIPDPDSPSRHVIDETKVKLFACRCRAIGSATSTTSATAGPAGSPWTRSSPPSRGCATRVVSQGREPAHRRTSAASGHTREFQVPLADPTHPDHDERLERAGGLFDPHRFEPAEADRALQRLAWRPPARASSSESTPTSTPTSLSHSTSSGHCWARPRSPSTARATRGCATGSANSPATRTACRWCSVSRTPPATPCARSPTATADSTTKPVATNACSTHPHRPRRTREGRTTKEILRCLKRHLIRESYRVLVAPHKEAKQSSLVA